MFRSMKNGNEGKHIRRERSERRWPHWLVLTPIYILPLKEGLSRALAPATANILELKATHQTRSNRPSVLQGVLFVSTMRVLAISIRIYPGFCQVSGRFGIEGYRSLKAIIRVDPTHKYKGCSRPHEWNSSQRE